MHVLLRIPSLCVAGESCSRSWGLLNRQCQRGIPPMEFLVRTTGPQTMQPPDFPQGVDDKVQVLKTPHILVV